MLLETIFKDLKQDEGILVFSPKPHRRVLVRSVLEALDIARTMTAEHANAYYGVAPRSLRDVEKVTRVPFLWLDLDAKDFPEGVLQKLCEAPTVPPTFRIASGHGYHLYWALREPVDAEVAGELMRSLWKAHGAGAGGRTYNAKWLLRVPGTVNFKDPEHPVPVEIEGHEPRAVFDPADITGLCNLSRATIRRLWTADNQGFKSRSERDFWAIRELLQAGVTEAGVYMLYDILPVGDRYAERGGQPYLARTVDAVKQRVAAPVEQAGAGHGSFIEQNGNLCYKTSKGLLVVATFTFTPRKLIKALDEGDEDLLLGDVTSHEFTWEGVIFPKSAFHSVANLSKQLKVASWQWLASDREVKAWLPYLMGQLYEMGLPHARGTSVLGRYGDTWLGTENTFSATEEYTSDNAPYVFVPTGRETPSVRYTFPTIEEEYRRLVRDVTDLLTKINDPEVIAPIIGWFMATPIKPVLKEIGERFPILNVYGTQGSGKSSTILRVCLPLMGWYDPRSYPSKTRLFVLLSMMASTNAIPISFGEFRDTGQHLQEEFLDMARRAYDTGRDSRGRPDQTTQSYNLSAPFCVDGEDAFSDPAVRERSVVVNMALEAPREGTSTYKAFQELTSLKLQLFAGKYIQRTLQETPDSVRRMFDRAMDDLQHALPMTMPDRTRRNLAVVHCGLQLYNQHAERYGGTKLGVSTAMWRTILERTLLSTSAGRTRVLVDDMVEDVISYAAQGLANPAFRMEYDAEQNVLWFHLTGAFGWWSAKRRREGRTMLQIQAIRAQLKELERTYALPEMYRGMGPREQRLVGVRVAEAEAAGLDVPRQLRPFTEVVLDVQI